jgi:RsiW-degrading membrane proteinase PrsW (M82 family)
MSSQSKSWIVIAGLLLALPGVLIAPGFLCLVPLMSLSPRSDTLGSGLASFTLLMTTLGAGGLVVWHGVRSMRGRPSGVLRLQSAWFMPFIFGLLVGAGLVIRDGRIAEGVLFPPILFAAAALPPLWAVAWFTARPAEGLSWRRGSVAFAGGATFSVFVAIILEVLLPVILFVLLRGVGNTVARYGRSLLDALAGKEIASAFANPAFIYVFIEIAIIAPLAEEFAKPLVTLPLVRHLTRREAFLAAAMAGAGFATLENMLYASFGLYLWAGIILVRALGGALHPLGAGLTGLAWRDILNHEPDAWPKGVARFALAVGMHAAWNGGSLIVITLAGAQFFGKLPPEINVLGLAAAGTTLAFLIVLGLAALWLGRVLAQQDQPSGSQEVQAVETGFALSDQSVAIWALACLAAIVPAGITSLQLLMR